MSKFLDPKFSSGMNSKEFRDNWNDVFESGDIDDYTDAPGWIDIYDDFEVVLLDNGDFKIIKRNKNEQSE